MDQAPTPETEAEAQIDQRTRFIQCESEDSWETGHEDETRWETAGGEELRDKLNMV